MSTPISQSGQGKDKSIRVKVLSVRNVHDTKAALYVKLGTSLGECKTNATKCENGEAQWNGKNQKEEIRFFCFFQFLNFFFFFIKKLLQSLVMV
jgi:hypothetical protein